MNPNNGSKIQVADRFKHLNPVHNLTDSIQAGSFHRIGTKGKNWKLMTGGQTYSFIRADDGSPLPNLDVVIIGINGATSKLYYSGAYNEESTSAPTCASLKGDVPDPGVPIPQSPTCANCKHNEWPGNRRAKECQDHKRVAVVLLPTMKTRPALEKPLVEPVFFKVPPASLKVFKAYCDDLQSRGAHFASVITRVGFDPEKTFQFTFDCYKPLTDADADLILPLLEDPATANILGSMPEFTRHLAPPLETPQETGFAAAFGKKSAKVAETEAAETLDIEPSQLPAKRGPGRPRKLVEEAKPAEAVKEPTPAEESAEPLVDNPPAAFEEVQDNELDSMLSKVLGNKMGKMMPS